MRAYTVFHKELNPAIGIVSGEGKTKVVFLGQKAKGSVSRRIYLHYKMPPELAFNTFSKASILMCSSVSKVGEPYQYPVIRQEHKTQKFLKEENKSILVRINTSNSEIKNGVNGWWKRVKGDLAQLSRGFGVSKTEKFVTKWYDDLIVMENRCIVYVSCEGDKNKKCFIENVDGEAVMLDFDEFKNSSKDIIETDSFTTA